MQQMAEAYVQRFGGASTHLRRMLDRHAQRAVREQGADATQVQAWIDQVVTRLQEAGAIDDARWTQAAARTYLERGKAPRAIAMQLRAKGLQDGHVREALAQLEGESDEGAELAGARALVRRRRLGHLRPADKRAELRDKDLAALLRAGFSWAVAKKALAGDSEP